MNTLLTRYLQRQLVNGVAQMRSKTIDHRGNTLPTRTIIVILQKYVRDFLEGKQGARRWVVVPGLRGVGKTTTLAQQYLQIHQQIGDKVHLLYISLDEVVEKIGADLSELIDEYERLLPDGSFESTEKPVFLFIDEVQVDEKWARTLKFLYDRVPNVFIFCSGSSATHLQIDADVDGRRAVVEKLYPLSFTEFQVLLHDTYPQKGLKAQLRAAIYGSNSAKEAYERLTALKDGVDRQWTTFRRNEVKRYLATGTIPFTLHERDERQVYAAISGMVDKIVSLDMQSLNQFDSDSIGAMKQMLMILSDSDAVPLRKLEAMLPVSYPQVVNILDAFVKAELLIKIPAQGNNVTATTNPSRYFFMSPAIRASFHDIVGIPGTLETRRGMLLEDAAALHFYKEFIAKRSGSVTHPYDKDGGQCDFIVRIDNQIQIPIEFGLGNKDFRQVESTLRKYGGNYGIVFSSHPELAINTEETVVKVPLDYFYLM